jgi:hypothetical protein
VYNHCLTIYVPSNIRGNEDLAAQRTHAKIIAVKLTKLFGGCTVTEGTGYYQSDNGEPITENVKIIHVFIDNSDLKLAIETLTHEAELLKMFMCQTSVLMTIDGEALFC